MHREDAVRKKIPVMSRILIVSKIQGFLLPEQEEGPFLLAYAVWVIWHIYLKMCLLGYYPLSCNLYILIYNRRCTGRCVKYFYKGVSS